MLGLGSGDVPFDIIFVLILGVDYCSCIIWGLQNERHKIDELHNEFEARAVVSSMEMHKDP